MFPFICAAKRLLKMSLMSLELTDVSGSESKRHKMKQFIEAAKEYSQSKTENTAMVINRLLQVCVQLSKFVLKLKALRFRH